MESAIISLVILALGLVWLAVPFVRGGARVNAAETARQKERDTLLTSYERILSVLRDLDEDYRLGKLAEADYFAEREQWAGQGAAVLAALEKAGGHKPTHMTKAKQKAARTAQPDADAALDAAIEQAIASYVSAKEGAGD
jgi:hypothetical protein